MTKVAKISEGIYWAAIGKVEMFLNTTSRPWPKDFDRLKKFSNLSRYEADGVKVLEYCTGGAPFFDGSYTVFEVDAFTPRELVDECEKCLKSNV